jgi:VWFA-related protein
MRLVRRLLFLSLGFVLPVTVFGSSAQDAADSQGTFVESVDIHVVNVDVYVTDRKGNPVTGLTAKDFQVRENGKKVAVEYFTAFGGPPPRSPSAMEPSPEKGTASAPRAAAASAPNEGPVHIVLLVDQANIQPQYRNRVLREASPFLERWAREEGRVLVAALDRSLRVVQPFTNDGDAVREALASLEKEAWHGARGADERRQTVNDIASILRALTIGGGGSAQGQAQELINRYHIYADRTFQDVVHSIEVMSELVRSLSILPGRKILVHISEGMQMRPGEEIIFALQDTLSDGRRLTGPGGSSFEPGPRPPGGAPPPGPGTGSNGGTGGSGGTGGTGGTGGGGTEPGGAPSAPRTSPRRSGGGGNDLALEIAGMRSELSRYDSSRFFTKLVALANTHRVSFYTLNPAGGEIAALGADYSADAGYGASMQGFLSIAQASHRETLQLMAAETGGLSLLGGTDVDGLLEGVERDFGAYYSLGFTPRDADDALRKIKVKVQGRGLKVRYREVYLDRSAEERTGDRMLGTMLLGVDSNPLGVEVREIAQQAEGKSYLVGVLVLIPIGELGLVPQGGHHEARLEVQIATVNNDGQTSRITRQPFSFQVPDDQLEAAREQAYGAQMTLKMRPGEQRVAVSVEDQVTRVTSFVSTPMVVGATASAP